MNGDRGDTAPSTPGHRHMGTGLAIVVLAVLATGCVTVPAGPSVMVLPGSGKLFEQFQADDALCRQWAYQQCGITPGDAAVQSGVTSAVLGTAIGAGLGAAIGAAAGNPALGAAVGAGTGLFGGSVVGANAGYDSGYAVQQRYDNAYQQCMYAKGNQIPAIVHAPAATRSVYAVSPPPLALPPPPPGYSRPTSGAPAGYPPPSAAPPSYCPPATAGSPPGYSPPATAGPP